MPSGRFLLPDTYDDPDRQLFTQPAPGDNGKARSGKVGVPEALPDRGLGGRFRIGSFMGGFW
jgi:hypothetical protein